MKICRVPTYKDKMKLLLQKIEEHSNLMRRKRDEASFDLRDIDAVVSSNRSLFFVFFDCKTYHWINAF